MSAPDVSVVIPVHNKARYVEACLESVAAQSGVTLELICIDDGSTDGAGAVVRRFANDHPELAVKELVNGERQGAACSRNRGLDVAAGRFVQFTDADDLLPADALVNLVAAAGQTGADAVRGNLHRVQHGRVEPWPGSAIAARRSGPLLDLQELWIPWFHTCYLISRRLLSEHRIRYPDLVAGEDPVFLATVLTHARTLCVTPAPSYVYRQDEPRAPPTRRAVEDYLRHAELVKAIYLPRFRPCWDAYYPFVQDDLRLLLRQAALGPGDRDHFEAGIAGL